MILFTIPKPNKVIRKSQNITKVALNHRTKTSSQPNKSHITFARLSIILSGEDEAFESISPKLFFVAYTLLYSSEKSH
ncbi:TPA: hypothetical protein DEG21_05350 [Patescibacteria group bacterium]|nr:hypothetical protein [Candidatus Gracilibacteria bacterium]HBY75255.1 hypothetical protein [Candidatus Gracilibacteria bacterium]